MSAKWVLVKPQKLLVFDETRPEPPWATLQGDTGNPSGARRISHVPEPRDSHRILQNTPKTRNPRKTENCERCPEEKHFEPPLPAGKQGVRLKKQYNRDREPVPLSIFFFRYILLAFSHHANLCSPLAPRLKGIDRSPLGSVFPWEK